MREEGQPQVLRNGPRRRQQRSAHHLQVNRRALTWSRSDYRLRQGQGELLDPGKVTVKDVFFYYSSLNTDMHVKSKNVNLIPLTS